MKTRRATDNEVMLWHCRRCCNSGALLTDPDESVYDVMEALETAHAGVSPECSAIIGKGGLGVTRPNGWFCALADLPPVESSPASTMRE